MVMGFVADKDIEHILQLLPTDADYYFCNAMIPRALGAEELGMRAEAVGLHGKVIPDVREAYEAARADASADDVIYVGGSTFVVADLLATL